MLVALFCVVATIGEALSHGYWNVAYKIFQQSAPANIELVTLDSSQTGSAEEQARVLEAVRKAGARRVYVDFNIRSGIDRDGEAALSRAIRAWGGNVRIVSRSPHVDQIKVSDFTLPPKAIVGNTPVVLSGWISNVFYYAESSPYRFGSGAKSYPAFAADLADVSSGLEPLFYPAFGINFDSVRQVSASDLLDPQHPSGDMANRKVIITDLDRSPPILSFGHQASQPVLVDLEGVAGLEKSVSFAFGSVLFFSSLPLFVLIAAILWLALRQETPRRRRVLYTVAVFVTFLLPFAIRQFGVVVSPDASAILLLTYGMIRLWQKRTRRIQQTSASGLPNLIAFSAAEMPVGRDVVVAAIARYEEMMATLPRALHDEFALQIARRISIGAGTESIYHSDGGHFAWTEEARPLDIQFNHLEGLRALFSAPLQIEGHTFDTNIHFGLDRNEGLDALTRVNSALASANEALSNGRTVELFEASRLSEASWELSLHARIDEGLRNGDIWMAYQSQWDIASHRICGAEALIRWDHPTRGPIAPDAFILQAERVGRIDALTYWVLEQAITAALALNARGPRFQMSVNLSAQMVDKAELVINFAEIVKRRGIDPSLLTIEITETSSVRNRPAACHNLTLLRQMGFRLSIDDFGTGEASLAYLADLPSDELKLDRRFISKVLSSDRDRAIVTSTIRLAHDLGQKVVAEGIEDAATYGVLRDLGCDHAQGYYLGRPQAFGQFEQTYADHLARQIGMV